jgi:hypothetical protein
MLGSFVRGEATALTPLLFDSGTPLIDGILIKGKEVTIQIPENKTPLLQAT